MGGIEGAIIAPWQQLGLIGSVVIALGVINIIQWRSREKLSADCLAEVKACNAQLLDLSLKKIDSDNKLANGLEGLEKLMETALKARA